MLRQPRQLVDGVGKAVEKIPEVSARLEDYTVRTVTGGQAAMGEATVKRRIEDHQVTGQAVTINEESE
jgi:hypothetical protein